MSEMYDTVIIGSGPAGLAAAIYATRAALTHLVIESQDVSGGQMLDTYEVDNYPGFCMIGGYELGQAMRGHADRLGAQFVNDCVRQILRTETGYEIVCGKGRYETRTVILAAGARHRLLGAVGEKELTGKGVSYCATCDGALYRKKVTAVVGGGNVAVEDAIFLARLCEKVYLIHRRDRLRASKALQQKLFAQKNVELVWDSEVTEIHGEEQVEEIVIRHTKSRASLALPVDGVFIAVGIVPESGLADGIAKCDEQGYILASEECITDAPGFFAAGDVRKKALRQVITAASDGANAVRSAEEYLNTRAFSQKN